MPRPSAIPACLILLTAAAATTAPTTTGSPTVPVASTLPTTVPTPTVSATTEPTTAPVVLDPYIRRLFDQLADPDPTVRDEARQNLMGLPADALPRLLAVVKRADPILPAQAAQLHEIVCQVFLAGEPYAAATLGDYPPGEPMHNVIGLRWRDMSVTGRLGVPVTERWPGFPAGRWLRDGDMILGIFVDPKASLDTPPNQPTYQTDDLKHAITRVPDVRDIDLNVLRDGRTIRLSITLVPQPADAVKATGPGPDPFIAARQQRAEAYWQDNYAPIVGPIFDPPPDAEPSLDR